MAEKSIRLTDAQRAVVEDRGGALLVSAAAGSGKTKVLVDRLLAQVCDEKNPANLDDFLIITYTKAAAAELRGKIARELSVRLAEDGTNRHLQKQLTRIYLAQISTVHAFCATILRDYAHTLDIPADFRVAEEQEAAELRQQCFETLLEQCYQELAEDEGLRPLIDRFGYGRDDRRLAELVMPVYDAVRCRVDPEAWMDACAQAYQLVGVTDAGETVWGAYLIENLKKTAAWVRRSLGEAVAAMAHDAVLQEKYVPKFIESIEAVAALEQRQNWDEIFENRVLSFTRLPPVRAPEDVEAKETAQAARKNALQALKDAQACFYAPSKQILAELADAAKPIGALLALIRRFDRLYAQEKRRRRLMDFSDLEHEAIRLLCQKGTAMPTAAAREIGARYREILVDEYQDSNAVQERIFEAVSDSGRNRFMVGDVKQSIYRFRLADPGIFLEKYRAYPMRGEQMPGAPRKILLSDNFRSRPEILNAVNDVFSLVMSEEAAELSYGAEEALSCGRKDFAPSPQAKVELHCIELGAEAEEDGRKAEKSAEEAAFVAARIHRLLCEQTPIADGDGLRPVRPEDIVILMRSPGAVAARYVAALAEYHIPCVSDRGGSILETTEVEVLRATLQVLDNPRQDIPLAAAMASHVFGFTPEELAQMRAMERKGALYDSLCTAAQTQKKPARFLRWLETARERARRLPLGALIDEVLDETGLEAVYTAMPDGDVRGGNLRAFRELAAGYEQTRGGGLMGFLHDLDRLEQSGTPVSPPESGAAAGAVRIMSIHKSKGLEFPVVVLADLSRKFNLQDSAAPVLLDDTLLIGANVVDTKSAAYYPGAAKMAIAEKKKRQNAAEELRVLYVAMTRAKDMLIMTDCSARMTARLQKWNALVKKPLPPETAASAQCMGDWIEMAALCRTEAGALFAQTGPNGVSEVYPDTWEITFQSAQAIRMRRGREAEQKTTEPGAHSDAAAMAEQTAYVYPHAAAARTASKLTATQLKGRLLDLEAAEDAEAVAHTRMPIERRPVFRAESALSGREKGTATHLFMQFVRYECCTSGEGIRAELERLVQERFLTKMQAEAVDCARIERLFTGEFGMRILRAQNVRREFKFSILTDAGVYDAAAQGEQVMLQGVVDCFWEEADALVIVDFKTDRIFKDPEEKAAEYAPQLEAYAQALARIFQKRVREKYLYFFDCDCAVQV